MISVKTKFLLDSFCKWTSLLAAISVVRLWKSRMNTVYPFFDNQISTWPATFSVGELEWDSGRGKGKEDKISTLFGRFWRHWVEAKILHEPTSLSNNTNLQREIGGEKQQLQGLITDLNKCSFFISRSLMRFITTWCILQNNAKHSV